MMDKYTQALQHVSEMGLSPAQIAAIFSDKARINEHLDWVLSLDKDAALAYLEPEPEPVKVEKKPRKK